ncbi:MAG: glycosyltransferase family 9 protein [Nanoarchaeota archaeon]
MLGKFQKVKTLSATFFRKSFRLLEYLVWLIFDFSKFKRIETAKIKNVLAVLINQEKGNIGGDFVTLGILNDFSRNYPNVRIFILSDKNTIQQFGKLDKIKTIEYNERNWFDKIRKEKIDAAIIFTSGKLRIRDFASIKYVISGTRFSIRNIFDKREFGCTRKINPFTDKPMILYRYDMLESLGFRFKKKEPFLEITKTEENKANKFLKKNNISKFIVIHPGGKYVAESYRQGKWAPHLWNLDRYAEVADHFSEKGYKILITGSDSESILAEKINELSKNKIINVCGKFTIRESVALLKKAKLLIATDTSIVHIAYQKPVEAKIVELMGPSVPKSVGAWPLNSKRHRVLIDKGPAYKSMRKLPFENNFNCLQNIKTKDVIMAGEELLEI